jgi:Zn-dependent alcohol dehydrogenase
MGLVCFKDWGSVASPNGRSSTRSTRYSTKRDAVRPGDFARLLLGCGVVTGAGAVLNTANVSAGDTVVIFGAGGVGLNPIRGAQIAGASRIVVIDIQPRRLEAARRFGATDVIDSTKKRAG